VILGAMAEPAEIARRMMEIVNSSESPGEAMEALEPHLHPEIEYVNPPDAIEGGTRRGHAGMRLMFENFFAGAGANATTDIEEVEGRGDRALVVGRPHLRGESSGVDVLGPEVGMIFTVRDGLILRIEWHFDVDGVRARFEGS
jgi:ketosteroid isomerase-like protein